MADNTQADRKPTELDEALAAVPVGGIAIYNLRPQDAKSLKARFTVLFGGLGAVIGCSYFVGQNGPYVQHSAKTDRIVNGKPDYITTAKFTPEVQAKITNAVGNMLAKLEPPTKAKPTAELV
jgi:hypothetical protein